MRVPFSWLRELAPAAPSDPEHVAHVLTMQGVKLEAIEEPPAFPSGVVAGLVVDKRDIEGARACRVVVDAGSLGAHEVVCGAHNFSAGDLLPLALPGARLSDGSEISRREVRLPRGPEVSDGMLCAPDELGLGTDHTGILHLEGGKPGDDVRGLLGLDETVIVFEITPNRPDAMSIAGIAREAVAAFGGKLLLPVSEVTLPAPPVAIEIVDPALCPRYVGIILEGVAVAPSQPRIAARLRAAGTRPVNNVVDATNYVLLERGQPLHAFDLDMLEEGRIVVRPAHGGEEMTTLDGVLRKLRSSDLVIADGARAVAIAGVMGGGETEVTGSTTRVLLESAVFLNTAVLQTSKRLGLRSEASARFERGVDPEGTLEGALRCCDLLSSWAEGRVVAATDQTPAPIDRRQIRVRPEKVNAILGTSIPASEQIALLARLDIPARVVDGGYEVDVPGRFPDMSLEAHVAEDVGRIYGINNIPRTLPAGPLRIGALTRKQARLRLLRDVLLGCGLTEIVTWSFANREELEASGLSHLDAIRVLNPLHSEFSLLRPSVLPGLLRVARTNVSQRRTDLALFELGTVFERTPELLPREHLELGILMSGQGAPTSPHGHARLVDVFDVKGVVEEVVSSLAAGELSVEFESLPGLHPSRAGRVLVDGGVVGLLGELDADVAARAELEPGGVVAVVDAQVLLERGGETVIYCDVPRFPEVDRDLNVIVAEGVPASALVASTRAAGSPLLRRVEVIDVYRGPQVGDGRKSITMSLAFGAASRTLEGPEADTVLERILAQLGKHHGAQLRA